MARNVEIKATIGDLQEIQSLARKLSDQGPTTLHQKDIFFRIPSGRLKLRLENDEPGQLIYYQRADAREARLSEYFIHRTESSGLLEEILRAALGVRVVVEKERQLFLCGRTRIHLDRVAKLGDFVEIEVVLRDGESQNVGERELQRVMTGLKIEPGQIVAVAYADLLAER